jgi:hypothetical protein
MACRPWAERNNPDLRNEADNFPLGQDRAQVNSLDGTGCRAYLQGAEKWLADFSGLERKANHHASRFDRITHSGPRPNRARQSAVPRAANPALGGTRTRLGGRKRSREADNDCAKADALRPVPDQSGTVIQKP